MKCTCLGTTQAVVIVVLGSFLHTEANVID